VFSAFTYLTKNDHLLFELIKGISQLPINFISMLPMQHSSTPQLHYARLF
jgi:hypothetical protein